MKSRIFVIAMLSVCLISLNVVSGQDRFPDGTPISDWFKRVEPTRMESLGKSFRITDFGVVSDSTILQTQKIQAIIDKAHEAGGGVVVIPKGIFLSGSLFFKPKTHLHLEEGAVLKGSDDISHFELLMTRMEGQTVVKNR
ncbi:glycoside hydrolase family protein [Sphingobacterium phlebotomi]|uniref:hypothetical protein n=1 Tax=Sphingobacterium phlebotomi TaxID=2605433 RepID=UPI001653C7C0|nr:hypothetical protein [Sphingobacterium phlebotomi]